MGEAIEFASNGDTAAAIWSDRRAVPGPVSSWSRSGGASTPGIKEMADRLGTAGFVALAPDLYHGELAGARRDGQGRAVDDAAARPIAPRAT